LKARITLGRIFISFGSYNIYNHRLKEEFSEKEHFVRRAVSGANVTYLPNVPD